MMEKATFAGGCFWCIETAFKIKKGVIKIISGYTGGTLQNPTYEDVCSGTTGHHEAVEIMYDPSMISYEELLDIFWKSIDPTDDSGQFADRGSEYATAIFYHNENQKKLAEKSRQKIQKQFDKPIATKILPAKPFYPAEVYHQDFANKNKAFYQQYYAGSGRKGYLEEKWKK